MAVSVCIVCGYAYDPANGYPEGCVVPGTPFGALPETWLCPVCEAKKTQFIKR